MTKVYLEHNPFSGKTICKINGSPAVLDKCWGTENGLSRLQDWGGYFFNELDIRENDDSYEIEFFGLPADCKDMQTACDGFLQNHTHKQVHLITKEGKSSEHRIQDLRNLFDDMQKESPYESLRKPELRKNFEYALSATEDIGVVATMSSGKSTLINAMMGQHLLPARNQATTAIVAKIHNRDSQKYFSVKAYDNAGNIIEDSKSATLDIIERLNANKDLSIIELYGDIPNIHEYGMDVVLNDTPGPNNSATEEHKQRTYDLVQSDFKPMILYILDASKPEANDDNILLKDISEAINKPGTQSRDRFLFVLNRADDIDPETESLENMLNRFKKYLTKHGILDPQIFPVSARIAKTIRMKKNNQHTTEDDNGFLKYKGELSLTNEKRQFSRLAPLSFSGKQKQDVLIKTAQKAGDNDALMEIYSGVPAVEIAINEYIEKYAISAKVKKAVETLTECIQKEKKNDKSIIYLEKNREDREKTIEALKEVEDRMQKGQHGQIYRQKIDRLSITDTLNEKVKLIRQDLLTYFENTSVTNEIDVSAALTLIENIKRKLEQYKPKLRSDLEKAIQDSVVDTAKGIIAEYKKYVSELVNVGDFDTEQVSLSAMISTSINEDALLNEFSKTEKVKVGTRQIKNENKKWYKPWTWFQDSYYTREVYEERTSVDYKQLHDKIIGDIIQEFDERLEDIQDYASSQVEDFKTFFKGELTKLDEMMNAEIKKQRNLLGNERELTAKVKTGELRLQWIEQFNHRLQTVLAI